jgi:predicted MFS family arabinose efflux permease
LSFTSDHFFIQPLLASPSFQFLGFSTGAALGSLTMANASSLALGWVGASCVFAALSLVLAASRRARCPSPVAL